MASDGEIRKVLICGGGNGSHCLTVLAASRPNIEVRVLTLYQDEAERWSKICEDNNGMTVSITYNDGTQGELKSKPNLITKDPKTAAKGVSVIFLTVPAFAHESYFTELAPYIGPNTLIVGLPGRAGFEFQCLNILGDIGKQCAVASFESLPWACRILEFGKHVQLLGFKEILAAGIIVGSQSKLSFSPFDVIQEVLGEKPVVKKIDNYIAGNLMSKSIVHPSVMYGKWSVWNGEPLDEKPLFYQGVDDRQAKLLSTVSDEIIAVGKEIERQRPDMKMSSVNHIFDWYKDYYQDQVKDMSSLKMAMTTNKAYEGLKHPMNEVEGGKFVPDFTYRYTREDIPFGLVVMKGLAEIAGVPTPTIDEIINWLQVKLDKEYIVGNKLTGKDLKESRAPQVYGFKTLDDLFNV